jgi:hypothetical protein
MRTFLRTVVVGLLAAAITGLPLSLTAQTNDQPATTNKTVVVKKGAKKSAATRFHGKLAAVDKFAKTITVGTRTFQITSDTKIFKAGKPATLEDGVLGEPASGSFKPTADGKFNATRVTFGLKSNAKSAPKPAPETSETSK